MNTAETLHAMTDRGKFELLVMPILRSNNKDYQAIIHTGINAAGETIKSPVDGFCLVPESNPPHFIMIECTTTDISRLENKWLYNGGKKNNKKSIGDLIKANSFADKIRSKIPNARFTVILATNQKLTTNLSSKTTTKAHKLGLTCDIWEQSRLRDFLDVTREGHWLRKEYLGIDAEILSASLLDDLCRKNLRLYETELFSNVSNFVCRKEEAEINKSVCTGEYSLQLIVGESGFGKSVVAYRSLEQHIKNGGFGFWIPAEYLEECITLENSIEKMLISLYPTLSNGVGRDVFQIIREEKNDSKFVVVVDDINQTKDPIKLIRKLLALSTPQKDDSQTSYSLSLPYLFICPIWPQIDLSINKELSGKNWINRNSIGPMTVSEGKTAIILAATRVRMTISNADATSLSTKMGHDPIIISLFSSLITDDNVNTLNVLTDNVIEKFITAVTEAVANIPTNTYLSNEYRNSLAILSRCMLQERRLYPVWNEIKAWLGENSNDLKALRELIQHGKLCRLTEQQKLMFRHDRIQEALLIDGMTSLIEEAPKVEDLEILKEPFYSDIISKSLLSLPQNNKLLMNLKNENVLALVKSIRFSGRSVSNYTQLIIKKVKEWINEKTAKEELSDSVLNAMCWTFVETDSSAVLEITDSLPKWSLFLLARLRNGDALSGASYCEDRRHFEPSVNNSLRDLIIEKAKSQHKEKLITDLKQLLHSSTIKDEIRAGALIITGFLGFSEFKDDIMACWEKITIKTEFIDKVIWAASQCCMDEPEKYLSPLMQYWASLPDEENSDWSQKNSIANNLQFALARGIHNKGVKFFISCCDLYESLRWPITIMLHRIDDPDAIEFIVQGAANIQRRIAGTDRFSPWVSTLTDTWDKPLGRGRKLSKESLSRLKTLWENLRNDEYLIKQAFRFWLTGINLKEIDVLRTIPKGFLYNNALWKRVELGDHSAVKELIPILRTETHWFHIAPHVWCDDLINPTTQHLKSFKDNIPSDFSGGRLDAHYQLSKFLMMIPGKDAEKLLSQHWEYIGYSGLFIQTALYVGTPRCLELAKSSINLCPTSVPIFEHLNSSFGFMEIHRQKLVKIEHLKNLLPYLDRLSKYELWQCAEVCQRLGIPEWSNQHLSKLLDEKNRKRYHPSDDNLLQELDKLVADKNGVWRVKYWLEEFDKRHESQIRIMNIIDRWLSTHSSIDGLKIVAVCLEFIGTRKDLSILDKYKIEGDPEEILKIKTNTKFGLYRRTLE